MAGGAAVLVETGAVRTGTVSTVLVRQHHPPQSSLCSHLSTAMPLI